MRGEKAENNVYCMRHKKSNGSRKSLVKGLTIVE